MATNIEPHRNHDLIMISDADEDAAGATIWWRLEGDVDRKVLLEKLEALGYGNLAPPVCEPEVAIRRAAANLKSKRRLLRPLGRRGAWAIVEEEAVIGRDELKHWTGPTISLDKIGRPVLTNATAEEANVVKAAYDYHLDALTSEDISSWLIGQAERLGAVALRRGGGIYYMPPAGLTTWSRIVDALTSAQAAHAVYKVPTVRMTKDGARAILDSLEAEITAKVNTTADEVISGELGVRGLENRARGTDQLLAKVAEYEGLLGSRLDTMRELLAKLQEDVVAAKLAAEAAEEDAAS